MYSSFDPNSNEFVNKLDTQKIEREGGRGSIRLRERRIEIIMISSSCSSFMYIHIYISLMSIYRERKE